MILSSEKKYRLSSGTQVRQEDFGLLFYTMRGPRLYFLPLKDFIEPRFFTGKYSLSQWLEQKNKTIDVSGNAMGKIDKSLRQLCDKGVILEC
jgi:putative mycofactocin binding protein MftB